jgi:hypothetical protein
MPSPSAFTTTTAFLPNQNIIQVKMHANRFQDNLLSKRIQQLNSEEMKQRLKHQRASNELVLFLRECKKSTGYLAQMKRNNLHLLNPTNNDNNFQNSSTESKLFLSHRTGGFNNNDFNNNESKFMNTSRMNNQVYLSFRNESDHHKKAPSSYSYWSDTTESKSKLSPKFLFTVQKSKRHSDLPLNFADLATNSDSDNTNNNNSSPSVSSANSSEKNFCLKVNKKDDSQSLSSTFSSNSSDSCFTSISTTIKNKKLFNNNNNNNKLPTKSTSKPVFFPSTRLTLSNLDWFKNEDNKKQLEISLQNSRLSSSKDSDFKSKSLNFSVAKSQSNEDSMRRKCSVESIDICSSVNNSRPSVIKKKQLTFQLSSSNANQSEDVSFLKRPNTSSKSGKLIKINMSRSYIRRKQSEIIDEYKKFNDTEIMNSLRHIQHELDQKVKRFAAADDGGVHDLTEDNEFNNEHEHLSEYF